MFIVIEGIDNVGKSIQAERLFESIGAGASLSREPGGTAISENIRDVIVKGTPETMDATTELLLINAARREHIKQTIKPHLSLGDTVIVDRFIDSTLAYQGESIGKEVIHGFHRQLCFGLYPDMVFLIDLDPMIAYTREINTGESRFEQKGILYMQTVREKFLERAKANPKTHIVIDGTQSIDDIQGNIASEYVKRIENNE
jgi:dTMP kinase